MCCRRRVVLVYESVNSQHCPTRVEDSPTGCHSCSSSIESMSGREATIICQQHGGTKTFVDDFAVEVLSNLFPTTGVDVETVCTRVRLYNDEPRAAVMPFLNSQ